MVVKKQRSNKPKRVVFVCSVCDERLMTTISRDGTKAVYLGQDGKPHGHSGTKWTAEAKEEDVSLV